MNRDLNYVNSKQTQVMTKEQFEEIIDAILCGKYSWACVLILRCANYNPLHYIPYRTYTRLIKENQPKDHPNRLTQLYPQNKQKISIIQ